MLRFIGFLIYNLLLKVDYFPLYYKLEMNLYRSFSNNHFNTPFYLL